MRSTLSKNLLVKFLKVEDFAAGFEQALVADRAADRAAVADLLFLASCSSSTPGNCYS